MTITTTVRAIALLGLPALAFVRCGGQQQTAETPVSTMPSAEPPTDQAPELDGGTPQTPDGINVANPKEAATPPPKAESLSDAQIAAVTHAVNAAEIAQARVAQVKAKDAGVKSFAAMMLTHH